MIYFLADTHFGHNKDFIWEKRGFSSIEHHDDTLIKNFNSIVKHNDVVYFLGDFAWRDHREYFKQLNCNNWYFIHGNHDEDLMSFVVPTGRVKLYKFGFENLKLNGKKITLSHFPMLSWEKSHFNSILLYGHLHGKEIPLKGKLFDVGIDNIKNYPISLDEVLEIVNKLPDNWDKVNN